MLTRREFLPLLLAAAHAPAQIAIPPTDTTPPEAQTAGGRLRGRWLPSGAFYQGVPFAAPPVGPLRFRPPQPPRPWQGIREAVQFAQPAAQISNGNPVGSEDCLYLNLWVPRGPGPFPVFVWIHGGGFTGGRSFDAQQDGSHFAANGILCITIAYRLGVFGFLDLEPTLGPTYAGSANNGVRDAIAALTWVRANAHVFGGDPNRITVGGQSAGAKLTGILCGTPSAKPLFQSAVMESGGAERVAPQAAAAEVGHGFGVTWQQSGQPLDALRSAPMADLLHAQDTFQRTWPKHFPLRPAIDTGAPDAILPVPATTGLRNGTLRGKRLLIGTNLDESAFFLGPHPDQDPTAKDLANLPLDVFRAVEAKYPSVYPDLPAERLRIRSVTAEEYWVPSVRAAELAAGSGAEVYMYRFDYPGGGRFGSLSFHSEELRFVWDKFVDGHPSPEAETFAGQLHTAWINFLQGKPPAAQGLPSWPRYRVPDRSTVILNRQSTVESNPHAAELALWQGVL